MTAFNCCTNVFANLSRAAAKAASARLRRMAVLPIYRDWASRAATCERCHMRILQGGVSYCGKPLLRQIERDPVTDGCGCPTREKARSPQEHCPIDLQNHPARTIGTRCTCKWCAAGHRD